MISSKLGCSFALFLTPNPPLRSNSLLLRQPFLSPNQRIILIPQKHKHLRSSPRQPPARCSAAEQAGEGEAVPKWASWIPRGVSPERILRLISSASSSPICQFIEFPRTFLHAVDPRVKLVWLLALVLLPARSHICMRLGLVLYLSLVSIWVLPTPIWMDQLGRVAFLSGILFIMLGFGSDGSPSLVQLRTPPSSITGLPNLPSSLGGYSYLIMKFGPLQLTKKGLSVASTSACLSFTIFQSASLCLTTTTPEQLASAIQWFMVPLKHIGVPVAEIILTLLLSLRFINLVFDEVRDAALGIVARRIHWQQLTAMETFDGTVADPSNPHPSSTPSTRFPSSPIATYLTFTHLHRQAPTHLQLHHHPSTHPPLYRQASDLPPTPSPFTKSLARSIAIH